MIEEKAKSILQLERMAFEEIQFNRNPAISLPTIEYEMRFTRDVGTSEDGDHFMVRLTANLWSKTQGILSLKIALTGYFFCSCEDTALKESLINYNSIAILFPYIRSQISLITAQPDLTPIVLPPVNIVAMFENADSPSKIETEENQ